jgi:hypothetical protein
MNKIAEQRLSQIVAAKAYDDAARNMGWMESALNFPAQEVLGL